DPARHAGAVDGAVVVAHTGMIQNPVGGRDFIEVAGMQVFTAEEIAFGAGLHLVDEQWNLVRRAWRGWITDDQAAEQRAIHIHLHVAHVVMKRPRAYRFRCCLEYVRPRLAGANLVTPPSVVTPDAVRPRAVGIDPVA